MSEPERVPFSGPNPWAASSSADGGQWMLQPVSLHTSRLVLRTLEPGDLRQWLCYLSETEESFRPFFPIPDSLDPLLRFDLAVQKALLGLRAGTSARFMAFSVVTGQILGQVALNMIERGVMQACSMGWAVHPQWQKQGLGSEMCRAAMSYAFASPAAPGEAVACGLGLHRAACAIMPRNVASLRLAAKLGFRQEGMARQYLRINGVWEDHLLFGHLAEDFSGHTGTVIRGGGAAPTGR